MSERTEKRLSRSERPVVTPQPTRVGFFEWIEDKFKGRESRPRFFELRQAYGAGGMQYRPEVIHQKEFKPNVGEPEREEMVEIANKFVAVAQEHCDELGKPQLYVVHAINHVKGSAPYGAYTMKLRPLNMSSMEASQGNSEEEVLSDNVHRDALLKQSLEHQRSNDEHARFMQDTFQKSTGSVIQLQQEIIRELRLENQAMKGQQLDWWKAIQQAEDKSLEREMQRTNNKIKAELLERGAGLLMQMVPVVAKSLERGQNNGGALPASSENAPITPSPESISLEQFIHTLKEEQKIALFGHFTPEPDMKHVPGILTAAQTKIFADVVELKAPAQLLQELLPEGQHPLTMEQLTAAQNVVAMDQLMPLYAMIQEGHNQRSRQQSQHQA